MWVLNCDLKFCLQSLEPGRLLKCKKIMKWVNFGASPVYETLRPGWGTNPPLPLSVFLQFSLNWKQKPTVSQQRGDLKVKGQIPLYHSSFWHAGSQPMWLETLTDKRRALRTEVKPASESSPLTDDHKTIEKCTKPCSSSMCHVYTQTFGQKAKLSGIFKALGWWPSCAAFLGWLLSLCI